MDILLFDMFFFFLMIRRPPRSTLFPTRRSSDLATWDRRRRAPSAGPSSCRPRGGRGGWTRTATARRAPTTPSTRSEEHTSELQSRQYLVCRLLLEKKKKRQIHDSLTSTRLII